MMKKIEALKSSIHNSTLIIHNFAFFPYAPFRGNHKHVKKIGLSRSVNHNLAILKMRWFEDYIHETGNSGSG